MKLHLFRKGLRHDEQVVRVIRRHVLTVIPSLLLYSLLVTIPLVVLTVFGDILTQYFGANIVNAVFVLGSSAFYIFVCMFLFLQFIDYYLDVLVITNKRLMNVVQTGLFKRRASETSLFRIQDITVETKGVAQMMLGYGKLTVQTAAEEERFILEHIPHATVVARLIMDYVDAERVSALHNGNNTGV